MVRRSSRPIRAPAPTPKATPPPPKPPPPVVKAEPPAPPPHPGVELVRRCAEWASASQAEGTLEAIVTYAQKEELVGYVLDRLPLGSGTTGERLERVRRRLERAGGK